MYLLDETKIMEKLHLKELNHKQLKIIYDYEKEVDNSVRDIIISLFASLIFTYISNYEILSLIIAIVNMIFPIRFWYYISIGKKKLLKKIKLYQ